MFVFELTARSKFIRLLAWYRCDQQTERAGDVMQWILYILSLLWIGVGSCIILYTQQSRVFMKKALHGVDPGLISILPITIGALLIVSAYYSAAFWTIVFLGMLAIGKGGLFIFNPGKAADRMIAWFLDEASDNMYRLAGITAIILGTALLSWI